MIIKNSPNMNKGRNGQVPDMIVCHITEGAFDGAVSWLINPQSQVSSHFVVARDGRVAQLVDIENTAWANGTSNMQSSNLWHGHSTLAAVRNRGINANHYTISIEHEGRFAETQGALSPQQLEATINLVAHIREEVKRIYGKEIPITRQNLVGHHEITPRTRPNCPGAKYPFDTILARLQTPQSTPPTTPPTPNNNAPSSFAREGWEWAIKNGLTDGTNPTQNATREQVAMMLQRFAQLPR